MSSGVGGARAGGGGGATSPLTTKGDVWTRSGSADARQGVGADGTVATADGTQANGWAWKSPGGPAAGITTGSLWFDVSKYGAVAGDATNNLNKAWATIYPLLQPGSTVYIPDHPSGYLLTDPLIVPGQGVQFLGAGRHQSTIKTVAGHAKSAVVLGMPVKDNAGAALDADHFVPLSGVMDSGYGPGHTGIRYRSPSTGKIAKATYPRSPLTYGMGDSWGSAATSSLTIELAVEGYIGGVASCMPHGAVLGIADHLVNALPAPFYFVFTHGIFDNSLYSGSPGFATAQGGTANTITLAAATAGGLTIIGRQIVITAGTGAGQVNQITAYNSSTKVATVQNNWATVPDATSMYDVGNFSLEVHYRTGDGMLNGSPGPPFDPTFGGTTRGMTFQLGLYSGLLRITLQLNLNATVSPGLGCCWTSTAGSALANFIQTANPNVDPTTTGQLAAGLPAKTFQENVGSPFQINNLGISTDVCNNPGYPNAITTPAVGDWMLAGLSFSQGAIYTVATAGSTQTLNPAGPYPSSTVNDTFRYRNTAGSAHITSIDFTDTTTTDPYGGVLSHWWSGIASVVNGSGLANVHGSGFLFPISANVSEANQGVFALGFASNASWGAAIELGRTFETTTEDVYVSGFYAGIATINSSSTYNHTLRSFAVQYTYGEAIYGYEAQFRGTDFTTFNPAPRVVFRGFGSSLWLRNVQIFGIQSASHYAFVSHQTVYTGVIDIESGYFDSEGMPIPDIAFIAMEASESGGGHGGMRVNFFEMGSFYSQAPFIKLRGMGTPTKPQLVQVADISFQSPCRAVVQVDSAAAFLGTVERITGEGMTYDRMPLIESLDATGRSGVKALLDQPSATPLPPRTGLWTAGAVEVRCLDAADGQFSRLVPVGGGRYGTAAAPVWAGEAVARLSNPGPSGPIQAAAAYVLAEDYILASPTQV